MSERPDVIAELARLKDFQRRTVDYVHSRLWDPVDPAKRFLVADEVGLGKTLIARGVIAKTIDHLWDTVDRIDVVYICSNQQIARQNLGRLTIGGVPIDHADRLTMLPRVMKHLRENKVNFVSFTPGTSFTISESGGRSGERVLLQHLLARSVGSHIRRQAGWLKFFRGASGLANYERELRDARGNHLDGVIAAQFAAALDTAQFEGRPLLEVLDETVREFRHRETVHWSISNRRYRLIGRMRQLVAEAAVEALEPDLVILDEFQRFKDLLSPESPGADLARRVFDHRDARVLLLSATPYRMYTLPDEPAGDNHYQDFLETVAFLADRDQADAVARDLTAMRQIALQGGDEFSGRRVAERVEDRLRRVMCRTERLAATPERDGMLIEHDDGAAVPTVDDVRSLRTASAIASAVGGQDVFEYWRSAPYTVNLMERYQVKRKFEAALLAPSDELLAQLRQAKGLLRREDIETYQRIDPGNAKLRALADDVLQHSADRIAWIPPSLPYYAPQGAFAEATAGRLTKRLVFSAWNVVPKAVSVLLSYEVERRASRAAGGAGRERYEQRITPPLRFQFENDRLTGMPVLGVLYPSVTLAEVGDPWELARALDGGLPADLGAVRAELRRRIEALLAGLPPGTDIGAADERWYWAAPLVLDAHRRSQAAFRGRMAGWGRRTSPDDDEGGTKIATRLAEHVSEALGIDVEGLERRPDDLVDVLVDVALAGPGVTALRALSRVCGGAKVRDDVDVRDQAWRIAWGLRSLFNRPEVISFVRADEDERVPYWRRMVQHVVDGNLQAVLDEYVHVLTESEGLQETHGAERARALADVVVDAASIRTAANTVDEVVLEGDAARLEQKRVRSHFAMRFGRATTEDGAAEREGRVRVAFNSPFWPFVLTSTSVGQEGLDFHTYCHAVVHWNLPGNPVDLEQREGRVHRYKGHAVRRNIADQWADAALWASVDDPWYAMFLAAEERRPAGESAIHPYWVYPGESRIERHVALAPLSTETARYRQLKKSVGLYRVAIGQARQEDLVALAAGGRDLSWMQLNLGPGEAAPWVGEQVREATTVEDVGGDGYREAMPHADLHRTQTITQHDIERGRLRLPAATRSLFPQEKTTLRVEVNGRTFESVPWDPRIGEERTRSGRLRFGSDQTRALFAAGERWAVQQTDTGYRLSGPLTADSGSCATSTSRHFGRARSCGSTRPCSKS